MICQYREIGEGEWTKCDSSWYNHCQNDPHLDTRVVSKEYLEEEAKKETDRIISNLS